MSAPAITFFVPVRTHNESNGSHGHWRSKNDKRNAVKEAVGYVLLGVDWSPLPKPTESTPWSVSIIRVTTYPPRMDDDAVVSSGKSVRDAIARFINVDDKHRHIVRYHYDQQRGEANGVRVEIRGRAA